MSSGFWKTILSYLGEYLRIFLPEYNILINNSGICCFAIYRKKSVLIHERKIEISIDNIEVELNTFLKNLKSNPKYLGQSMVILIGGTFSFYYIRKPSESGAGDINALVSREDSIIGYRPLKIGKNRSIQLFFGIDKRIHEAVRKAITVSSVIIKEIIPLTYQIINRVCDRKFSGPTRLKFPGEDLLFSTEPFPSVVIINENTKEAVSQFEEADVRTTVFGFGTSKHSISRLLYPKIFLRREAKPVFMPDGNLGPSKVLKTFSTSLRLASLILLSLAIIALASSFILGVMEKPYAELLSANEAQLEHVSVLKGKNQALERQLEKYRAMGATNTGFAGIISSFCQRRPGELVLKQMDIFKDNEGRWNLTASGETNNEKSVMVYRDYVADNLGHLPLDISQLVKSSRPGGRTYGPLSFYTFKLTSSLSSQK